MSPRNYTKHQLNRGFTLIEVLVVVAIIALLAAILLPSLRQAREQAKIATCQANCKQIGTLITIYRSEYNGYVPIMFNYYSNGDPEHTVNPNGHNVPAKGCWLSVALRRYDKGTVNLKNTPSRTVPSRYFNPEEVWRGQDGIDLRDEFEDRIMPDYYACPFERGGGEGRDYITTGPRGVEIHQWRGRFDSYHNWLWERIYGGEPVLNEAYDWDTKFGIAKYSVLTWNQVEQKKNNLPPGYRRWDDDRPDNPFFHTFHRRWDKGEARVVGASNLASVTISWCAQGEHLALGNLRYNVGSHRTTLGGGTNAIFGDTHVEWVIGTRIGWR
ncbi:MAG: prepilin-type N-terminal cleavage/methylation domain-containing protein [Planctomycetota bacterium]|nr:MAG: prepilin-type N-terminal cleavage/methylation domain-containing protein [Planctomycetota bacterium]